MYLNSDYFNIINFINIPLIPKSFSKVNLIKTSETGFTVPLIEPFINSKINRS